MFSFGSSNNSRGDGVSSSSSRYQRVETVDKEGDAQLINRRPSKPFGPSTSDDGTERTTTATKGGEKSSTGTSHTFTTKESFQRLLKLARPERQLILMSAITMAFGSSVSLAVPTFSGQIIDVSIGTSTTDPGGEDEGDDTSSAFNLLLKLLSIMTLSGIVGFFRILWQAKAGHYVVARIRRQLYAAMLSQDAEYYDQIKQGDLLSRLSSDADLIQSAITDQALGLLRNIVISFGSVFLLFYTSVSLALVSVAILPPIAIVARYVGRQMKDRQLKVREFHAEATSLAEQALTCIKTVQQFVAERHESHQYNMAINQAHYEAIQTARLKAIFGSVMGLTVNLALLCVLGYGGHLVSSGYLSPGDLASFVMYSVMMGSNISSITSQYIDLMKSIAAANRVFEIIDRQPSIPSPNDILDSEQELSSSLQLEAASGKSKQYSDDATAKTTATLSTSSSSSEEEDRNLEMVEVGRSPSSSPSSAKTAKKTKSMSVKFQHVSFAYPTRSETLVLDKLSLSIEPGQMVALVGGSGGGKSTIAALLTRLYDPKAGTIQLNGIPINKMSPQDLRQNIGIVVQEPLLFPTSIEDNIRYGSPNATYEEVYEAARLAFVTEFSDNFPYGLQTVVGPRGTQLSGGQKQRVAVARCILKNPPVLIFDEATSALDAESESAVQKAIDIAAKGRTVIMIAHRLSTIRNVDQIAVLKNGCIVEIGTFDDLVNPDHQQTSRSGGNDDQVSTSYFRQLMEKQLLVQ